MLVVASSAVYLITALLEGTATKLNLIQKQVDSNGFDSRENFRSLVSGGHLPKQASQQPESNK